MLSARAECQGGCVLQVGQQLSAPRTIMPSCLQPFSSWMALHPQCPGDPFPSLTPASKVLHNVARYILSTPFAHHTLSPCFGFSVLLTVHLIHVIFLPHSLLLLQSLLEKVFLCSFGPCRPLFSLQAKAFIVCTAQKSIFFAVLLH